MRTPAAPSSPRLHHALLLFAAIGLGCAGNPTVSAPAAETPTRATTDKDDSHGWDDYYRKTADRPPSPVLVEALGKFTAESRQPGDMRAVDAGCGAGADTLYMLERGLSVQAFDAQPSAIRWLKGRVPAARADRLHTQVARFHDAELEPGVDLVYAGYALPFAEPGDFDSSWANLVNSLAVGGRFAGHFFGDRDEWAGAPKLTHHTRAQVEALFRDRFTVEKFEEIEEVGPTATGKDKHWHLFVVIARKTRD